MDGMTPEMEKRVALWDAINRYVATCGGDASKHVYGNTSRMKVVAEVERIVFAPATPTTETKR